uniref:PNPL.1c n=1 Tax=Nocardiopsis sp. 25L-1-1c TaxID=1009683 RepID=R4HCU9_9ACTN|nr:pNPL.1c [Nocardiopsis sp. 25L-1-1c]
MTDDKDPDRTPYRIVDDVLRGLTITRAGGSYTRADLQANDIMAWHERWETGGATPEEIGVIADEIASCLGVEVDL